jgi:APA family basic amino acid/polyamine antiporter
MKGDPKGASVRLKSGQISPIGLAALAIGIMSPALGLFALWAPMQAAAGPIVPLVFLASAALALPTAISYASLNSTAPSVGAASTWLWRAVSPSAGYLVGLTMAAYFILAALAQPLLFGLFFRDLLAVCGFQASGLWVLLLAIPIITAPVMWATYRGAEASTRLAVALMTIESAVVIALSITILLAKGSAAGGVTLHPFDPSAATHGFSGFWTAMLLGILAYCGFDVVSTAAEETNAPAEHVPRAIILTILGITLFWAINAWIFTLAMPNDEVVRYSTEGLTAVTPLAAQFWGAGKILVILTAITGICAVYVTGALGASRIIFALARHGLLPSSLARLDPSGRVPRQALHLVFGTIVIANAAAIVVFRNGLVAFTWWANALVFFATLTFTAVNTANIFYFRRVAPEHYKVVPNLLVPLLGAISTLYVMYETFFVALWSGDFKTGGSVVYFCLLLLAVFIGFVWYVGRRWPRRLQGAAPVDAQETLKLGASP